jgi:hypothetical protein
VALIALAAVLVVAVTIASCGGTPLSPSAASPGAPSTVLVGAGDIAQCGSAATEATAALLDGIPGIVFTAGDNAYPHGSDADFRQCYEPTWGRHRGRTRPSPGNHDYESGNAVAYFNYFGGNAGPPGLGYYSFRVGDWLVLSLNSNVDAGPSSAQAAWVRSMLVAEQAPCVAAIWHHPVFSSGQNGGSRQMQAMWKLLREFNAEVVISGHDHEYERFARLDENGRPDPRGLRSFVVGTGGAEMTGVRAVQAGSEVRASVAGVLKLTLRRGSYDWTFESTPGSSFRDGGADVCH